VTEHTSLSTIFIEREGFVAESLFIERDTSPMPRVTVVIPTFNRAIELERCLSSLVHQTFQNFDVFICDDGSTDHTAHVVTNFEAPFPITYLTQPNSGGPAKGRNTGIRASESMYIAFLDSDDWWSDQKLEKAVHYLDLGHDLVYHDLHRSPKRTFRLGRSKIKARHIRQPSYDYLLRRGNVIPNSSVVVKRNLLEHVGLIDENPALVAAEDFDLWIRLSQVGCSFKKIPHTLGYYQIGVDSLSTSERILKYLEFLKQKYMEQDSKPMPIWFHIARGRALQNLGQIKSARAHFWRALFHPGEGLQARNRFAAAAELFIFK